MCVIAVADKRRLTETEARKMAQINGDGMGFAYRDRSSSKLDKPDIVRWEKGITLERLITLASQVPLPYVAHFRIGTCGGKIPEMTHPFPIEKEMRSDLQGFIKGSVLFHNGHWGAYNEKGLEATIKNKIKPPSGKWSDSRVMAWLAHLYSTNVLEFLNEKIIVFGPSKIEIFHPDGFFRVNDLLVSNRHWERAYVRGAEDDDDLADLYQQGYYGPRRQINGSDRVCLHGKCKELVVNNTAYCAEHQPPCREAACPKPRIAGTEFCLEHQPSCETPGCMGVRLVNETICLRCMTNKTNQAVNRLASKPEPGGASPVVPFRSGAGVVPAGADRQGGAAPVQEQVGEVGAAVQGDASIAVLNDPVLQEQSRWAISINPKRVHTATPAPHFSETINTISEMIGAALINNDEHKFVM